MVDEARDGLERELSERLEEEMQGRQAARDDDTDAVTSKPNAADPAVGGSDDARESLEAELQRELDQQLSQMLEAPEASPQEPESAADDELSKSIEAELQAELAAYAGDDESVTPKPPASAPAPKPPKRRRPTTEVTPIPIPKQQAKPEAPAKPVATPSEGGPISAKVVEPKGGEQKADVEPEKPKTDKKPAKEGTAKRKTKQRSPKSKTNRRPKKAGNGLRPRQSNTRNLSDQEQMLLQEKAKIDAKFRVQQRLMYVGITVGTVVLAAIILPLAFKLRGCIQGGSTEEVTVTRPRVDRLPSHITGTRRRIAPKLEPINNESDLDMKVNGELKTYNYQVAVDYLEKFMKDQPDYSAKCQARINEIAQGYIEKSVGSRYWQMEQNRIAQGMFSTDPADVRAVISGLKRFGRNNSKERFVANYYVGLMTKRHVELTGGLLPY